ncbi:UPF0716 family protein affecting phage T7 exclusion [Mucilaginibacter terrae]|uniref:UPF0716 family protein affecting phage T7 exclusion n=2 Tax=Mucilaginibacter terrae TaxID=1955052 RepID=A0ABU3GXG9_9SPHI|nr:UPF0716 family protein affecting phage T7 exclusion [Mucilaginibacter terrae]
MKSVKVLVLGFVLGLMLIGNQPAKAQCAMCSATAEAGVKNGNTEANGLNNGILYLLAAPYIALAVGGYVWYKKYRRKDVDLNMQKQELHLN